MLVSAVLGSVILAGTLGFQQVNLVSGHDGELINYGLPYVSVAPVTSGISLLEQVEPVWRVGSGGLRCGTSVRFQSIFFQHPIGRGDRLLWSAGVSTSLLLPRGTFANVDWHWRRIRLSAGVSLASTATWARLLWNDWSVLPTLGLGIGPLSDDGEP